MRVKKTLKLPSILSNNMMVQQNKEVRIWGEAVENSKVNIKIVEMHTNNLVENISVKANCDGMWEGILSPIKASYKPYNIVISNCGVEEVVTDILVGDIWLSAGQSNMQLNLKYAVDGKELAKKANNDKIRIFYQSHIPNDNVAGKFSIKPVFDVCSGEWKKGDLVNNVQDSSAISYSFALTIFNEINKYSEIPIGIINTSTGSSSIHTWLSSKEINENLDIKRWLAGRNNFPSIDNWNTREEWNFNQPTALYNHKIAPIINHNIKGVLWYQGENDVGGEGKCNYYKTALNCLINSWSREFNRTSDKLDFAIIQLAPFNYEENDVEANLSLFRQCQYEVYKTNSRCSIIVPIHDIDLVWEYGDFEFKHPIHPLTKIPVGERVANGILEKVYKVKEGYLAPELESFNIIGDTIILNFTNHIDKIKENKYVGFKFISNKQKEINEFETSVKCNKVNIRVKNTNEIKCISYGDYTLNNNCNLKSIKGIPVIPFKCELK